MQTAISVNKSYYICSSRLTDDTYPVSASKFDIRFPVRTAALLTVYIDTGEDFISPLLVADPFFLLIRFLFVFLFSVFSFYFFSDFFLSIFGIRADKSFIAT